VIAGAAAAVFPFDGFPGRGATVEETKTENPHFCHEMVPDSSDQKPGDIKSDSSVSYSIRFPKSASAGAEVRLPQSSA